MCTFCGDMLPAWLPVAKCPDGALLLHHLSAMHREVVGSYLARIHTDADHNRVVVEAYEVVEGEETS
jgi:hypothetical protein